MTLMTLAPGIYPGLDRREWPSGLSASGAKDLLKAPAIYKWRREHPSEPTPALDLGTAVHSLVLGVGEQPVSIEGGRGKSEREAEAKAAGQIPLTPDLYQQAADMAQAVLNHTEARQLLDYCDQHEVAAFAPDPDTGIWLRGQLDMLGVRLAGDLKTVREGSIRDFQRDAYNLDYHLAAAVYLSILEWLGRPVDEFAFVLVEKAPPYLVAVRLLDAEFIDMGRRRLRRAFDLYQKCTESGEWPGHEPYAYVSAPRWARED